MRVTCPLLCFSFFFFFFRLGGVKNGAFEGDPAFSVSSFFFFLVFLSNMFRCWQKSQSFTKDVSSVVGAPRRCGVMTTKGGIAGIGLGHLLGREHDSSPQSGVEAPRLVRRSLSRLYYCCCCCCCCCFGDDVNACVCPHPHDPAEEIILHAHD